MRVAALVMLAALAAAPAAFADLPAAELAPGRNASFNPADAPAGAYEIDGRHASVIWRVRHTGLGLFTARFDTVRGALSFDPHNPAASQLSVTVDAHSVSTNVADNDHEFDRNIARVLGAQAHPEISFTARNITQTGPQAGLIEGDLTLNGQTHPVTFEARFQGGASILIPRGGKYVLAFSGRTILNRKDWGVSDIVFDAFAADEVEVLVDVEFVKS